MTAPITDEALEQCISTLSSLWQSDRKCAFFLSPAGRDLRKAVGPFARALQSRMFGGVGRSDYEQKAQLRRERQARQSRQKALDRKHVDSVKLRQARIDKLAALAANDLGSSRPRIPDGFAEDPPPSPDPEEVPAALPPAAKLHTPRACYVCKARFTDLHDFYDRLCPSCAALNFRKRAQSCDLSGRAALVTGGRVKIGFCVALKLLRWGARVVVTTRFPRDCAARFSAESDFSAFGGRLAIYGLDFRDFRAVERFCDHLVATMPRLDVVVNNACQTIRRPAMYYAPLLEGEAGPLAGVDAALQPLLAADESLRSQRARLADASATAADDVTTPSAALSQLALLSEDRCLPSEALPAGSVDVNGQQLDLRERNTWVMKMEEVETPEVAEVFAINAIAPFVINSRLLPLLARSGPKGTRRFIVNVSAMEGKFYRVKSPYHPHTNMAKAALNMMTRTSSADLRKKNVFMTAVDTGWINDENPLEKAKRYADKHHFQTPIDEVDAAARILDPVVHGLDAATEEPYSGVFLKDYRVTEW